MQTDKPVRRKDLFRENLIQAWEVIRSHRMRSFLLILGVAIGIMTILGMVTVLSGLGRKINRDLVSASRPYLTVQKHDIFVGGEDLKKVLARKDLTRADAEAMELSCPSLDKVCYFVSPSRAFILRRKSYKTKAIQVFGASYTMPSIYSLAISRGRFYTELDEKHRRRVVVLGYGPAEDLFPHEDPLGKFVRIGAHRYRVIGTFARRKHILGGMSDNFAVLPSTTYEKDFFSKGDDASISANGKEGRTLEQGEEEITNLLRKRRRVKAGEDNDFVVMTSEAFTKIVGKTTFYIGMVLMVIASIGLVVGGIGVMNIMLISVAERTREIGVRMALGARKRDVVQQVLVESAALTGLGGLAGTVLGVLFAFAVSKLLHFPFFFSLPWTLTAVIFSCVVGLVFGIYPARRASRLDPVEALRYE